jgi:exonuclease SbcD
MVRPVCEGKCVRILHTSYWHLGHTLKDVTREHEHAAFLAWLVETCVREEPDAVVITGDVFDSGTPPASAERMWFEWLAAVRRARPDMDVVVIAGNHDSPARLGAASAVLRELGVHVVGGLPRDADGAIDVGRVVIRVAGGAALVAAVPFLRPGDYHALPCGSAGVPVDVEDPLAAVYGEVIAAARAMRTPEQALIVLGHLYVAGAAVSSLSERRIAIGGVEAASARLFPEDVDYVALGHMHRAQRVGRDTVRYAGAPIPLALDESGYAHQVVIVDFASGRVAGIRAVRVPKLVDVMHVEGELGSVVAQLAATAAVGDPADPTRPYLEVIVHLARPEPRLRALIEHALEGKRPRLVRLVAESTGHGAALADVASGARRLAELDPRDVFAQCWAKSHSEAPSAAVIGAFDRLLDEVRGDRADPGERGVAS